MTAGRCYHDPGENHIQLDDCVLISVLVVKQWGSIVSVPPRLSGFYQTALQVVGEP